MGMGVSYLNPSTSVIAETTSAAAKMRVLRLSRLSPRSIRVSTLGLDALRLVLRAAQVGDVFLDRLERGRQGDGAGGGGGGHLRAQRLG
jgi:hypothetical protein